MATTTTKERLVARGYETRANAHPGNCDSCGAGLASGAGRIVQKCGNGWTVLCRTPACTAKFLRNMGGTAGDSPEGLTEAEVQS